MDHRRQAEFRYELLRRLVVNTTLWRRRRIEQITPLDRYQYRVRVSLQLNVPRQLIEEACVNTWPLLRPVALEAMLCTPTVALLPVAMLPKTVLINFSIWGPDGTPIPISTRFEASRHTSNVIKWRLSSDESAKIFFRSHMPLIRTIAFLSAQDLRDRYIGAKGDQSRVASSQRPEPMTAFLGQSLERYFPTKIRALLEQHSSNLNDLVRQVLPVANRVQRHRELYGEAPDHDPICNPLLGALDYFKLATHGADLEKISSTQSNYLEGLFTSLLDACRRFLTDLTVLPEQSLATVANSLDEFVDRYFMYCTLPILPDQDFVIKYEQLVPAVVRDKWSFLRPYHQCYDLVLGDAQSVHYEVTCSTPTELEQKTSETKLFLGEHQVEPDVVFGYKALSGRFHQHFYTTKTKAEASRAISARYANIGPDAIDGLQLSIRFRVDRGIAYTAVISGILSVIITIAVLVSILRGHSASSERSQLALQYFIIAALAVWAVISRVGIKEKLVADRLVFWTVTIGVSAVVTILAVLCQICLTG